MNLFSVIHTYQPDPVIWQIGFLTFRWYGLFLAVGLAAGYYLIRINWLKQKRKEAELDKIIVWLVLAGLLGARLLDVFIFEWWYFQYHPKEIFYIWQGGLAWHGALLGGAVFLYWSFKKDKSSFWQIADIFAPALALGQAIGRWGNYFNQELFGLPTALPWGISINVTNRPAEFINFTYFHPIFLYEFFGLILLTVVLLILAKKNIFSGQLFAFYLIFSGLLRFTLEFLRIDEQNIFLNIRAGFWLAGLTVVAGLWLWYKRIIVSKSIINKTP